MITTNNDLYISLYTIFRSTVPTLFVATFMPVYATLGNLTVVTVAHFGAFCRGYGPKKSVACSAKKRIRKRNLNQQSGKKK